MKFNVLYAFLVMAITHNQSYGQADPFQKSSAIGSSYKVPMRDQVGRLGIAGVYVGDRGLSVLSYQDFLNSRQRYLGVKSYGVGMGKSQNTRLLPFTFEVFFPIESVDVSQLNEYSAAALGAGFAEVINGRYFHQFDLTAIGLNRVRLSEGANPVIVDRLQLFSVAYTGQFKVIRNVLMLQFSGKLVPLNSTRWVMTPEEIQQILIDESEGELAGFSGQSSGRFIGQGMSFHNDYRATQRLRERGLNLRTGIGLLESVLGGAEFSAGVRLLRALDAQVSIHVNSVQAVATDPEAFFKRYEADFISYQNRYLLRFDFDQVVTESRWLHIFRGISIFSELVDDRSQLYVYNLPQIDEQGLGSASLHSWQNYTFSIGLLYRFNHSKDK